MSTAPSPPRATLRQGALVAGVGYILMMGTAVAEYGLLPKLIVDADAAQTTANILAHPTIFNGALMLIMTNFVGDVLAAWGLYVLLEPVHASLSLLAAWFRLVYTAIAGAALLNLATVRHLLLSADYPANLAMLGASGLHAQVKLSIDAWETQFSFSLFLFGLYLVLLGALLFKAGYLRRVLGVIIVLNGLGWTVTRLGAHFFPGVHLDFLGVTFYGELVLMVWLLVHGWRSGEPA
jgi:hypothetical protein